MQLPAPKQPQRVGYCYTTATRTRRHIEAFNCAGFAGDRADLRRNNLQSNSPPPAARPLPPARAARARPPGAPRRAARPPSLADPRGEAGLGVEGALCRTEVSALCRLHVKRHAAGEAVAARGHPPAAAAGLKGRGGANAEVGVVRRRTDYSTVGPRAGASPNTVLQSRQPLGKGACPSNDVAGFLACLLYTRRTLQNGAGRLL